MGIVREEIFSQKTQLTEKNDPALQPYEAYKVDFDYFKLLFAAFSPWGKGEMAESLAARIFRVSHFDFCQNIISLHTLTCCFGF